MFWQYHFLMLETPFAQIELNRNLEVPLHRQLYEALRALMLEVRIVPNSRLPASRALAVSLGISRNTVLEAFEQLTAEGYLESRVGAGSFVAGSLPAFSRIKPQAQALEIPISKRGVRLQETRVTPAVRSASGIQRAFDGGTPAFDEFPFALWAKLEAQVSRAFPESLFGYGDPMGFLPLRQALVEYLGASRGVRCTAENILITTGSQQGLDLASRVLTDPGDEVWLENPSYMGARGALIAAGARLIPVPVDVHGLIVSLGIRLAPKARMAFVTPSHQSPLSVTMSVSRRLELLSWAQQNQAWVLEDDYDSEYRFVGRPLESLHALDSQGCVIYLGTFSKVLMPGLRIGYVVAPPQVIHAFTRARALQDRQPAGAIQAVLSKFLTEGHFVRHIHKMRKLYAQRQETLLELATRELTGLLELQPSATGLQLVAFLPDGVSDQAVSARALKLGVSATPLSSYYLEHPRHGFILGFAHLNQTQMHQGIKALKQALLEKS
jgi:GntR family transcriptional regulator / MocR family aminotransferase